MISEWQGAHMDGMSGGTHVIVVLSTYVAFTTANGSDVDKSMGGVAAPRAAAIAAPPPAMLLGMVPAAGGGGGACGTEKRTLSLAPISKPRPEMVQVAPPSTAAVGGAMAVTARLMPI